MWYDLTCNYCQLVDVIQSTYVEIIKELSGPLLDPKS